MATDKAALTPDSEVEDSALTPGAEENPSLDPVPEAEAGPSSLGVADWPAGHRSGFVAIVGAPNVGKSTIMNYFLGQKLAIVSPKPQTTRQRILGILTREDAQVLFLDTPGLHKPVTQLGEYMVSAARDSLDDADVVLWVVDGSREPDDADRTVAEALASTEAPKALILNKRDQVPAGAMPERQRAYLALATAEQVFWTAATLGRGMEPVLDWIIAHLPAGPRYYPEDQLTDREERFLVAELIREQALLKLRHEVPHAIAVTIDEFKERQDGPHYVAATLYVEKESQKPIVIGAGGATLKAIGTAARAEIERLLGHPVYLALWVKVRHNWRRNPAHLRALGYRDRPER